MNNHGSGKVKFVDDLSDLFMQYISYKRISIFLKLIDYFDNSSEHGDKFIIMIIIGLMRLEKKRILVKSS